MTQQIDGMSINPPDDFAPEEVMYTFRVPARAKSASEAGRKKGRPSIEIRPNLIVHRKPTPPGMELRHLVEKICAELLKTVPGIEEIRPSGIEFSDGVQGVLLEYAYPGIDPLRIAQLQALRLDGGRLTTLTISTEAGLLVPEVRSTYVSHLASAKIATP